MDLKIVQQHLVLVKLPKDDYFAKWGCVQLEFASSQEQAIEQAIQRTPQLQDHIAVGEVQFLAVPLRDVPIKLVTIEKVGADLELVV